MPEPKVSPKKTVTIAPEPPKISRPQRPRHTGVPPAPPPTPASSPPPTPSRCPTPPTLPDTPSRRSLLKESLELTGQQMYMLSKSCVQLADDVTNTCDWRRKYTPTEADFRAVEALRENHIWPVITRCYVIGKALRQYQRQLNKLVRLDLQRIKGTPASGGVQIVSNDAAQAAPSPPDAASAPAPAPVHAQSEEDSGSGSDTKKGTRPRKKKKDRALKKFQERLDALWACLGDIKVELRILEGVCNGKLNRRL